MPAERRSPIRSSSDVRDRNGDQNRRRRPQDALPRTSQSSKAKAETKHASETSDRVAKELGDTTDPAAVTRSRSFAQHDDRGTAAQDGRRSGRRLTSERGRWTDFRTEGRATHRITGYNSNEREEKREARGGDSRVWRHDRFSKVDKNTDPPTKKRRQFREEKLPLESEPPDNAAPEPSKDMSQVNSIGGTDRREERDRHRPSERSDYGQSFVKARSSKWERIERTDMPPRNRFTGGEYDGRSRGMDNFGGRQGYQSSGGRAEKWKHDMFDEASKSPAKTDEDPVAKVEALLSL